MYSLMSMRIMDFSESYIVSEIALQSSVLPTPVGPRNIKEAMGRFTEERPALLRRIALLTDDMASSWPTTLAARISSRSRSLAFSPSRSFEMGIPVDFDTTWDISADVTESPRNEAPSSSREERSS